MPTPVSANSVHTVHQARTWGSDPKASGPVDQSAAKADSARRCGEDSFDSQPSRTHHSSGNRYQDSHSSHSGSSQGNGSLDHKSGGGRAGGVIGNHGGNDYGGGGGWGW